MTNNNIKNIKKEDVITIDATFACYKRYCHPKFKPFVSKIVRGKCFINEDLMFEQFQKMLKIMQNIKKENKKILFVGTKKRIKDVVEEIVSKTDHFYINHRWIGGLLTNFNIAHKKRNLKYQELQKPENLNFIKTRPKKEQMLFKKELERLEKSIKGILNMKKIPDYIFLIDSKIEKTALKEANSLNIPVLAITQMNMDPINLEAFIPANDNSELVVRNFLNILLSSFIKEEINKEEIDKTELKDNKNDEK